MAEQNHDFYDPRYANLRGLGQSNTFHYLRYRPYGGTEDAINLQCPSEPLSDNAFFDSQPTTHNSELEGSFMQPASNTITDQQASYPASLEHGLRPQQYLGTMPSHFPPYWNMHCFQPQQVDRMPTPITGGARPYSNQTIPFDESSIGNTATWNSNSQGSDSWPGPQLAGQVAGSQGSALESHHPESTGFHSSSFPAIDVIDTDVHNNEDYLSPGWRQKLSRTADGSIIPEHDQGTSDNGMQPLETRVANGTASDDFLSSSNPEENVPPVIPCQRSSNLNRKQPRNRGTKRSHSSSPVPILGMPNPGKRHKRKYTPKEREDTNWKRKNGICPDCKKAKRRVCPLGVYTSPSTHY